MRPRGPILQRQSCRFPSRSVQEGPIYFAPSPLAAGKHHRKVLQGGHFSDQGEVLNIESSRRKRPRSLSSGPDPDQSQSRLKIMVSAVQFCPSPRASSSCTGPSFWRPSPSSQPCLERGMWCEVSVAVTQMPTSAWHGPLDHPDADVRLLCNGGSALPASRITLGSRG